MEWAIVFGIMVFGGVMVSAAIAGISVWLSARFERRHKKL